jgi:hypothetical protein
VSCLPACLLIYIQALLENGKPPGSRAEECLPGCPTPDHVLSGPYFPTTLRFDLLVGIAGGVPDKKDICLGNVIVSKGDSRSGEVVAHDRRKEIPRGFESQSFLNRIPELLRNTLSKLESLLIDQDSKITEYLLQATARNPCFSAFEQPILLVDNLYNNNYIYINLNDKTCTEYNKS